jgi:hypothetical protein
MVDIETGGITPGSSIFAIGATMFDFFPELITLVGINPIFYQNASRKSNIDIGLKEDASTMEWWKRQSKDAQDASLHGVQDITDVLADFAGWYTSIKDAGNDVRLWGKGAGFEAFLLEAAYKAGGWWGVPWHRRELMDYRTLEYLFRPIVPEDEWDALSNTHVAHTALGDAIMQARKAEAILGILSFEGLV